MRIGLALSGGGFRATLYHLGLVQFLYQAGILKNVTHITSVSGGSIIAAHLCLNWNRYTGAPDEFEAAASELLAFIRLDVRNRILRRYPLALPARAVRSLFGLSNRKLTRPGLLEYHYEKYLYGDTSLFQLPESPSLHLLATNISEGRLCSFNRNGLWVVRRGENHTTRIEQIHIGLATVPMAVAASSAFPGFFPPIMLTGADVGSRGGEYGKKAYTDGGVFDNLGVRMFRCLAHASPDGKLPWDGVLVSDAGRPFEVQSKVRAAGIIRTAMRASDILMDRVWQLETETFRDTPGFAFARITNIVDPEEDPTALHPEVQRQLSGIRTDLDRFSDLEISGLIRHGYCVGGKTCRARPDLFGKEVLAEPVAGPGDEKHLVSPAPADLAMQALPEHEPTSVTVTSGALPPSPLHRLRTLLQTARDWIESAVASGAAKRLGSFLPRHQPTEATRTARTLNAASARRVWTTLLDHRDWTSYVYVPLIVPLLFLTPYFVYKAYERSHRINQIYESLAQESRDLEQMTRLIDGPAPPFTGERAQALPLDKLPDPKDFTILQDLRIVDLRRWNPASGFGSSVYGYRRLKVRREPNNQSNAFRISVLAISPDTQVRFPPQQLKPELYSRSLTTHGRPEKMRRWEVGADLTSVPPGEPVDIIYEHLSPGLFLKNGIEATTLAFDVEMETIELSRWILLPQDREYGGYQLVRHLTNRPSAVEIVKPVTEFRADDRTILAFKLLALKPGFTYELTWFYR